MAMRRPTVLEIEFGILAALTFPVMVLGLITAGRVAVDHILRFLR